MATQSLALECTGPNQLDFTQFDVPDVEHDCALIQIQRCGICGTDIHGIRGMRDMKYPFIPGHELVGTVVEKGSGANKTIKTIGDEPFREGDRITVNPRIVCGRCFYCQNIPQRPEMCINARTYNSSITSDIPPHLFGGWAEYMYILPGSEIIKVPEGLSDDLAVLAEPFACGLGCVEGFRREHDWIVGDGFAIEGTVVIFGVGAIGMLTLIAFRLCGARSIIAVDLDDDKLTLAKEFGATEILNPSRSTADDRVRFVKQVSQGIGASVVVEACGVPGTIGEGVEMLRRGGTIYVIGHLFNTKPAEINPRKVCRDELRILGNYAYSSSRYFSLAFRLLAEGELPYEKLVTTVPFSESRQYILGRMPHAIKTVIVM
ncbi:MAG: alcohol dehydrogenase catalytic domain-containing protein [Anaerolineae bacterium]|nr:alcohol dehydrogenase catalytic domain-containing protein [Anaerolineae bacterium]